MNGWSRMSAMRLTSDSSKRCLWFRRWCDIHSRCARHRIEIAILLRVQIVRSKGGSILDHFIVMLQHAAIIIRRIFERDGIEGQGWCVLLRCESETPEPLLSDPLAHRTRSMGALALALSNSNSVNVPRVSTLNSNQLNYLHDN
jgi:hypothetical protein